MCTVLRTVQYRSSHQDQRNFSSQLTLADQQSCTYITVPCILFIYFISALEQQEDEREEVRRGRGESIRP
jgi:hypothetical protein